MAKIVQVRGVPDAVHRELKARAARQGRTLSDLVRDQLIDAAARPPLGEFLARIREREPTAVRESAAEAVRAERSGR